MLTGLDKTRNYSTKCYDIEAIERLDFMLCALIYSTLVVLRSE